ADAKALVGRWGHGGLEALERALPAVTSADLRLNTPRNAARPNVLKAKKKPLEEVDAASLRVSLAPTLQVVSTARPADRKPGSKVGSVAELVAKLKDEARVI